MGRDEEGGTDANDEAGKVLERAAFQASGCALLAHPRWAPSLRLVPRSSPALGLCFAAGIFPCFGSVARSVQCSQYCCSFGGRHCSTGLATVIPEMPCSICSNQLWALRESNRG